MNPTPINKKSSSPEEHMINRRNAFFPDPDRWLPEGREQALVRQNHQNILDARPSFSNVSDVDRLGAMLQQQRQRLVDPINTGRNSRSTVSIFDRPVSYKIPVISIGRSISCRLEVRYYCLQDRDNDAPTKASDWPTRGNSPTNDS